MEKQLVANAIGHLLVGLWVHDRVAMNHCNYEITDYYSELITYRRWPVFGYLSTVNLFGDAFQFGTERWRTKKRETEGGGGGGGGGGR